MTKKNVISFVLIVNILILVSLACSLIPTDPVPGTLAEEIAKGNIRFEGSGNLSYGKCQDPMAVVTVNIGAPVKEYEGQEFYDFVLPVTVIALTDGSMSSNCEKINPDDKHNWPAKGLYYPKEARIVFYNCSVANGKAGGKAYLVGEGFEGEYACYHEDGSLAYNVAFSVYSVVK